MNYLTLNDATKYLQRAGVNPAGLLSLPVKKFGLVAPVPFYNQQDVYSLISLYKRKTP